MKNFEILTNLLKQDERFISTEWDLLKNKIQELAIKLDEKLIELLYSDDTMRTGFFKQIDKVRLFDSHKFIRFINNKEFLPNSYTAFKNKIGLADTKEEFIAEGNDVLLNRPYKDCILAWWQDTEDAKRDEIFYNEILWSDEIDRLLDPKVFTNFKRYDKDGKQELKWRTKDSNGNIQENLIVKGNNLLVLHTLKKKFAGKVKLVYVDPPYNTWWDTETFTYNNTFKHSTRLTFMRNRLEVAKEFLTDDWFIAITIDHVELFYLGVLADEIFGRENRVGVVSIVIRPQWRQFAKFFSATTEYMLVYAKDYANASFNDVVLDESISQEFDQKDEEGKFKYQPLMYSRFVEEKMEKAKDKYYYPIYVSNDLKDITLDRKENYHEVWPINNKRSICWKVQKEKLRDLLNSNKDKYEALKNKKGDVQIYEKYREGEWTKIKTHWIGKRYNATTSGTGVLKSIMGEKIFSYPKSVYAVQDTIKIMTTKDDIILDFFAGSWTTGHATLELNKEDGGNRKFILVEQLEEHVKICKDRNRKVISQQSINDSFIYFELKEYNQTFIDQIKEAENTKELLKIWGDMKSKGVLDYNINLTKRDNSIEEFKQISLVQQKQILIELLDKNNLYMNLSEMNDKTNNVSNEDKTLTNDFYK